MRITTYTATLELKAEKANAHSGAISSVAYSPDGSQILTGSYDKSLKVWELRPFVDSEWEQFNKTVEGELNMDTFEMEADREEHWWRNTVTGGEQKEKSGAGEGSSMMQFRPSKSGIQVGIESQITRSS